MRSQVLFCLLRGSEAIAIRVQMNRGTLGSVAVPCPFHPSIETAIKSVPKVSGCAPHRTSENCKGINKNQKAAAPSLSDGSARGKTDHTCQGLQIQSGPRSTAYAKAGKAGTVAHKSSTVRGSTSGTSHQKPCSVCVSTILTHDISRQSYVRQDLPWAV